MIEKKILIGGKKMKTETRTKIVYITDDGKKFSTKEAAEAHEKEFMDDSKYDEMMEQIKKNNERLDELNNTRVALMRHIDAIDEEFDRIKEEQEKLFKDYYGEDKYGRIMESFNNIFDKYFKFE